MTEPPPVSAGADQDSVDEAFPVVAFKPVGALGKPTGSKNTDDGVPNDDAPPTTYTGVNLTS